MLFAGSFFWLRFSYRNLQSSNNYATELQCNGCWNFLEAYSSSTLEYDRFYQMLPEDEAQGLKLALCGQVPVREEAGSRSGRQTSRPMPPCG